MSKNSTKQRYEQLVEWLKTIPKPKQKPISNSFQNESRLEYYSKKGLN